MIRVVWMDIGNVLINFDMQKLLGAFLQGTEKTREEVLRHLIASGLGERYEKGLISSEEFFGAMSQEFGYGGSFTRFKAAWNQVFFENPQGVAAFRSLKKRLPVFLTSNTNALHFEYLSAEFPVLREADGAVLSHEVHARKPEPEFFRKALELTGVRPEEALLIDDLADNVFGARKIGAAAIIYSGDAADLARDLQHHGLSL